MNEWAATTTKITIIITAAATQAKCGNALRLQLLDDHRSLFIVNIQYSIFAKRYCLESSTQWYMPRAGHHKIMHGCASAFHQNRTIHIRPKKTFDWFDNYLFWAMKCWLLELAGLLPEHRQSISILKAIHRTNAQARAFGTDDYFVTF